LSRLTMWLHRVALDSGVETAKGLSKKIENHAAMVRLYFMNYNVPCVYQTLRVTPAMEAGLADPCLGHRRSRRSPLIRPRTYSCTSSSGYASRRQNSKERSRKSSGRSRRSSKNCASARPKGGVTKDDIPNSQRAGHGGREGKVFVGQKLDRLRSPADTPSRARCRGRALRVITPSDPATVFRRFLT
jgi:hypothetical protein